MAVNCAAIPSDLLESEVFGHERGAFSGAHQRHLGYAERARGGILFLDEIAAMPLALQSKMLRVLEERSLSSRRRRGDVPLKARIVCATSENLGRAGAARRVPRGPALPDQCRHGGGAAASRAPGGYFMAACLAISRSSRSRLKLSCAESVRWPKARVVPPWRGNVRELRNRVERAVNLATGPWLMPADLFPELRQSRDRRGRSDPPARSGARRGGKRQIERVLRETGGQIGRGGEAARDFANDAVGEDAPLWNRAERATE